MTTTNTGLPAPFQCQRVCALVEPTGEVVQQHQRLKVRTRRAESRFLWLPITASRNDIDEMLEAEKNGSQRHGLPIVTDFAGPQ